MSRKTAEQLAIAEGQKKDTEWENWSDELDREDGWWMAQDVLQAEREELEKQNGNSNKG